MKNRTPFIILAIVLLFSASATIKASSVNGSASDNMSVSSFAPIDYSPSVAIDSLDTLVFNMGASIYTGSKWTFPVYFKSDDVINAVDFSFMYNHAVLDYDTIVNLKAYLQSLENYNSFDSTVYYTSFSTTTIDNNTNLMRVKFNVSTGSGSFQPADVFNIIGYLNGDVCAVKIIPLAFTGLNDANPLSSFVVYPNPASGAIYVQSPFAVNFDVQDISGKSVVNQEVLKAGVTERIVLDLAPGIYFARIQDENNVAVKLFVVE